MKRSDVCEFLFVRFAMYLFVTNAEKYHLNIKVLNGLTQSKPNLVCTTYRVYAMRRRAKR